MPWWTSSGAIVSLLGLYHSQACGHAASPHASPRPHRPPQTSPKLLHTAHPLSRACSSSCSSLPAAPPLQPRAPCPLPQILAAERTSLAVAAVVDARACGAALPHASPPADYPSASPAHTESRAATGAVSRLCASLVRWVRAEPPCGGAPRWAVLLNAACAFGLAQLPYSSLVEVEMTLYCASQPLVRSPPSPLLRPTLPAPSLQVRRTSWTLPAHFLDTSRTLPAGASHLFFLAAFLALRVQRPHAARLFRVPGGTLAAAAYCVPPLLICVATVTANTLALRDPAATDATVALRLAALALVAASAVHLAVRRVAGTASGSPPEDSEPAGGSEPPAARAIL